jgi:pimeloyl-ACP methyl ester carboxylesterase
VHLARPVAAWNRLVRRWHLPLPVLDDVGNSPAWPDTNYGRNPVASLAELMLLIRDMRRTPPRPACPTLLMQSDRDDVVQPCSADELAQLIGGEVRVERLAGDRHVCLRGEGAEQVWMRVAEFAAGATAQVGAPPPRRFRLGA